MHEPQTESRAPDLSIVIACYNEEEHIEKSLPELEYILKATGKPYELVIVDDASRDNTPEILRRMLSGRDDVIMCFHETNQGRGTTVQEGMHLASGKIVGYLDIDLEVGPWYILPAIDPIERGEADAVIAHRVYKIRLHPGTLFRQILSIGFRTLSHRLLSLPVRDAAGGFKFFRRKALLPILDECREKHWFWDTEVVCLAHRKGLKVAEIPCLFIRNPKKTSSVKIAADIVRQFTGLLRLWRRNVRSDTA